MTEFPIDTFEGPQQITSVSHTFSALGTALMLFTLFGVACVLAILLTAVFVSQRWMESVPRVLRYVSFLVVIGGLFFVGVFMNAVSYAPDFVTYLQILVFVPLGVTGLYLYIIHGLSVLDTVVAAGLAWSMPFLVGFIGLVGAGRVLEQLDVNWALSAVWVLISVLGTLQFSKSVSRWLASPNVT